MTSRTLRIAKILVREAASPAKIDLLARKYPQVGQELIQEIADSGVDPTGDKGVYLEWLVRRVKEENIRWPEDQNRVKRALNFFVTLKPSDKKKYNVNPDIGKYTLHNLEKFYREVYGKAAEGDQEVSTQGGSHEIYDDGNYRVVRVGGPGTDLEQAVMTACAYANETFWCTEDPETAKTYLERGPLFLVFKKGEYKPVAQTDGYQLMNRNDEEINFSEDPGMYKILMEVGAISKAKYNLEYAIHVIKGRLSPEEEKYILQDPEILGQYIERVVGGRWIEVEPIILQDAREALNYYSKFFKGARWPELERALLSPEHLKSEYAINHLVRYALTSKRRWPEAEPYIRAVH